MTKEEEKYTTLDTEQCKWWVNTLFNMAKEKACNSHNFDDGKEIQSAQNKIIKALEQEEYYKNLAQSYEKTINKLTKAIAEQQTCDDCVSREQVEKIILNWYFDVLEGKEIKGIINLLDTLPPVTLTHGTCKDCKHWKDSGGVYRRGVGAESKCPINIKKVYEGTFYCADFEKRGSEE